jgi:hypothetical protein
MKRIFCDDATWRRETRKKFSVAIEVALEHTASATTYVRCAHARRRGVKHVVSIYWLLNGFCLQISTEPAPSIPHCFEAEAPTVSYPASFGSPLQVILEFTRQRAQQLPPSQLIHQP